MKTNPNDQALTNGNIFFVASMMLAVKEMKPIFTTITMWLFLVAGAVYIIGSYLRKQ